MKLFILFIMVLLLSLTSGCGTFLSRSGPYEGSYLYPAVSYDIDMIANRGGIWAYGDCGNGFGPVLATSLHVIDFPFSVVIGTFLLPIDLLRKKIDKNDIQPEAGEYRR